MTENPIREKQWNPHAKLENWEIKTQNNDKPKLGKKKNNQTHMQTLESDETKIRLNHWKPN